MTQLSLWACCICHQEIGDNEFRWWWNKRNVSLTPRRAHQACFSVACNDLR